MSVTNGQGYLSPSQRRRGWMLLALYVLAFPYLCLWVQRLMTGDAEPVIAEANVICYALFLGLCGALVWRFLREDVSRLMGWDAEDAAAAAGWLAVGVLGRMVLERLKLLGLADPAPAQYAEQYLLAPAATLTLLLVLIPAVEELLFRGVLFSALDRRWGGGMAYPVTVTVWALCRVWRYALERGDAAYLVLALLYLPMSVALARCYDRSRSVWGCAVLHACYNGATLAMAL